MILRNYQHWRSLSTTAALGEVTLLLFMSVKHIVARCRILSAIMALRTFAYLSTVSESSKPKLITFLQALFQTKNKSFAMCTIKFQFLSCVVVLHKVLDGGPSLIIGNTFLIQRFLHNKNSP